MSDKSESQDKSNTYSNCLENGIGPEKEEEDLTSWLLKVSDPKCSDWTSLQEHEVSTCIQNSRTLSLSNMSNLKVLSFVGGFSVLFKYNRRPRRCRRAVEREWNFASRNFDGNCNRICGRVKELDATRGKTSQRGKPSRRNALTRNKNCTIFCYYGCARKEMWKKVGYVKRV